MGISPDGHGGVYISGQTEGSLAATNSTPGIFDAFLARYDENGNLLWTRQLASPGQDLPHKVSADGKGNVFIVGSVIQPLPGETQKGNYDAYIAQYDENGNLLWTDQFGTAVNDTAFGVSTEGLGRVYVSGLAEGPLFGPSHGGNDASSPATQSYPNWHSFQCS